MVVDRSTSTDAALRQSFTGTAPMISGIFCFTKRRKIATKTHTYASVSNSESGILFSQGVKAEDLCFLKLQIVAGIECRRNSLSVFNRDALLRKIYLKKCFQSRQPTKCSIHGEMPCSLMLIRNGGEKNERACHASSEQQQSMPR